MHARLQPIRSAAINDDTGEVLHEAGCHRQQLEMLDELNQKPGGRS
jgi:hypothetical protein